MRIFFDELRKRHRARLGALLVRHKATIGYAILCVGVIVALIFSFQAQNEINYNAKVRAAILCENITRNDRQTLANLHTSVDRELIKSLHLTKKQVDESVAKQLKLSAEQRKALQPSLPPGSCSTQITTLKGGPLVRKIILTIPNASKVVKEAGRLHESSHESSSVHITKSHSVTAVPLAPVPRPSPPRHHRVVHTSPPPSAPPRGNSPNPQRPGGSPHPATPPPTTPNPTPTPTPQPPEPPLVRVPPVKVGPITTPEITVG